MRKHWIAATLFTVSCLSVAAYWVASKFLAQSATIRCTDWHENGKVFLCDPRSLWAAGAASPGVKLGLNANHIGSVRRVTSFCLGESGEIIEFQYSRPPGEPNFVPEQRAYDLSWCSTLGFVVSLSTPCSSVTLDLYMHK